jgi:tetratricopeptide (TPR) repeat protein
LETLRESLGDSGELIFLTGRCLDGTEQYQEAAMKYKKAYEAEDTPLEMKIGSYELRARVLRRRLDKPEQADRDIAEMVEKNPDSYLAYLTRWRYRKSFEPLRSLDDDSDLKRALELAPDNPEVLYDSAELAMMRGEFDTAREQLTRSIELQSEASRLPQMYLALVDLEARAKRMDEAERVLRQAISRFPGNQALLMKLCELLIERRDLAEAETTIAELRKAPRSAAIADYMTAQLSATKGDWDKAARALERARPLLIGPREQSIATDADLLLAQCYGEMGDVDRQLSIYQRLANADRSQPRHRLAVASALVALDRIDEALRELRNLAYKPAAPLQSHILLARTIILRNLRSPVAGSDWTEVDDLLDRAAKAVPDSVEVILLQSEALLARQKVIEANDLLEHARAQHPDQVDLWTACASLADRQGDPKRFEEILVEAKQQLGDRIELQLARVAYWMRHGGAESRDRLVELEQSDAKHGPNDRSRLIQALIQAQFRLGNIEDVQRLVNQLSELRPFDLRVHQQAFELAYRAQDDTAMERVQSKVAVIEGQRETPIASYMQAIRLLARAKRENDKESLPAVRRILSDLAARRPAWRVIPRAMAEVEEMEGRSGAAIDEYLRAIELGERDSRTMQRVLPLLYTAGRFDEAQQLLRKLQEQVPLTDDLQRFAGTLALQDRDPARALKHFEQALAADPDDYRNHMVLGGGLWMNGEAEKAEASLRRAVELGSKAPETWILLVQFLAENGRKDEARAEIQLAQERMPRGLFRKAMVQFNEAIGQVEQAEEELKSLAEAQSNDYDALRMLARFYLKNNPTKAETPLRKLIDSKAPPDISAWARQTLAKLLAAGGGYQRFLEAVALMETRLAAAPSGVEDLRAYARVLATRAYRRRDAIRVLEGLADRKAANTGDQFMLAQLHDAAGNWTKARLWMGLVASEEKEPIYAAVYARGLIEHDEMDEARVWVAKLKPTTSEAQELRIRLLVAEGKEDEALAIIREYLSASTSDPKETAMRNGRAAILLDEIARSQERAAQQGVADKLDREAEACYRADAAARPETTLKLGLFLANRGRVSEALDLYEQVSKVFSPESICAAAVALLRTGRADDDHCERVNRWIETAIEQKKDSLVLMASLAELRSFQRRFDDALKITREVQKRDPTSVVALNNLAWLLLAAKQGKDNRSAALALINEAIKNHGPEAELLDTRATVYLAMDQADKAIEDLKLAIEQHPTTAKYLHLANAHLTGKDNRAADAAWQKMQALGIDTNRLNHFDREMYDKVLKRLNIQQ